MKKPRSINKKIVLGLTGGFGTGKSTVALILKSLGGKVVDADKLAGKYLKKDTLTYKKIIKFFGKGIVSGNGEIDRKKLAGIAFKNKANINRLNNIIHPRVINDIRSKIESIGKGVIVLDVPLLFEAGLEKLTDKVAVVKLDRGKQLKRLKKKSLLSNLEINRRIKMQLPLSFKVRRADFIIDNNGEIEKTKKQIQEIWKIISCQLNA